MSIQEKIQKNLSRIFSERVPKLKKGASDSERTGAPFLKKSERKRFYSAVPKRQKRS